MSIIMSRRLVDIHTHLCVLGGEPKEDFTTGAAVAPAGGSATVLVMPNLAPRLVTPAILAKSLQKAQHRNQ